jgi:hypothetical protein
MLWVSPVLALSLVPFNNRIDDAWGRFWVGMVLCILVASLSFPVVLGVHWGPRFILTFIPLLLLLACMRIQRWWAKYPHVRPFLVVVIAVSIFNQLYSYDLLMTARNNNRQLTAWVAVQPAMPAVTNSWWLPGDCALDSWERPWYVAGNRLEIANLIARLRENKVPAFLMYENPPYLQEADWWFVGAEVMKVEYYMEGGGKLKRSTLKIIS